MKKISPFRIVLIGFFAFLLIAGVIAFSTYRSEKPSDAIGEVEIWGTFDSEKFDDYLYFSQEGFEQLNNVKYKELPKEGFEHAVLEAMASGNSPDLLFIDDSVLSTYLDKTYVVTPEAYSRSTYGNNFVDVTEIFLQNDGIVGFPLAADPLVMYWNRDLFASAGVARPPTKWSEFLKLSQILSLVDESLNVRQSAIAFGETKNIDYFKNIIVTLLLQIGNPIIGQDYRGNPKAVLDGDQEIESAHAALLFYTEFSDASKSVYSWNRSLPDSEDSFLAGKLAVYFAPASQIANIRRKNPNLNFAIAEIPMVDESVSRRKSVYAPVYGFVIPRVSTNVGGAFQAATVLTQNEPMKKFSELTNLAPVRRDLIDQTSQEAYQDIIKKEALYAQTFLDPDEKSTTEVLENMVEYITSGQRSIDSSIYVSNAALDDLLQ